ncbi:hypothetical protein ABVK25_006755 [Lepraria finkii]|uniref:DUF7730 domain-containing protein n=1 Tax=Lepraria finkii TaxID=1340010 RepID=A0ABR4B6R3_9LECA
MQIRSGSYQDRPLIAHAMDIALHNASSLLLKLPLELKNTIYKEVYGGHLHVNSEDGRNVTFTHQSCCAILSKKDAETSFQNETEHPWYASNIEDRHRACGRAT